MSIIKKLINYSLLDNHKTVLEHNNVECFFDNNVLEFDNNIINLDSKTYKRETDEFILKLDFNTNVMDIFLKNEKYNFTSSFVGTINIQKDNIVIEYKLEDEILKQIKIYLL